MSIMELLGFFDPAAAHQRSIEAGKQAQWTSQAEHLLRQVGPGHMVIGVRWLNRDGWECSERKAFKIDTPDAEIEAWKQSTGWPGHSGGWWNYFKDDLRAKLKGK